MKAEKEFANGIYISIDGKLIHRYRFHMGELTQLPDSTFGDEIIRQLEFNISTYEEMIEHISDMCDLGEGEDFGTIEWESVEKVKNTALEVADNIMENDIIMGELLYADLMNCTDIFDDGTAQYFLDIMNNTLNALKEPLDIRDLMFAIVNSNCEYNDPAAWYEQYILPETNLFCKRYRTEFLNRKLGSDKLELTQVYFFSTYAEYFVFCILHFAEQQKQARFCKCCGKFFIPKNKNNTSYCDRVLTPDGKTCKQAAPKLMVKFKKKNDEIFEEYERVRNRNYKRYDRGSCKLDNEKTEKDLTRKQYDDWLYRANDAMRSYVQRLISREEFREIIYELG